jgi:hemerythrin
MIQTKAIIDNLNNVRREASRHFSNKNNEYLKAKFDELETHSKIKKNIRRFYKDINDFKKNYQPRTTSNIRRGTDKVRRLDNK